MAGSSLELDIPPLSATNPINGSSISSNSSSSTSAGAQPKIKSINPLPHRHHKETNDRAVREAKAEIRNKLREDWEFPVPASVPLSFLLDTEGVRWVEREDDSPPPSPVEESGHRHHKWDNPEPFAKAHAPPNHEQKQADLEAKRRRRQDSMAEEMVWNEGFRHWVERRDAWTAARNPMQPPSPVLMERLVRSRRQVESLAEMGSRAAGSNGFAGFSMGSIAAISSGSSVSDPSSLDSHSSNDHTPPTSANPSISSLAGHSPPSNPSCNATHPPIAAATAGSTIHPSLPSSNSPPPTSPSPSNPLPIFTTPATASQHQPPPAPPPPATQIPIPPPLLPTSNPVRASITPKCYTSLYSKIAIQALTPTIPINLSDMVRALVAGWKKEGEWPPKGELSAFAAGSGSRRAGTIAATAAGGGAGGSLELAQECTPGKVVRRSVGRVKRALGLGSSTGGDAGAGADAGAVGMESADLGAGSAHAHPPPPPAADDAGAGAVHASHGGGPNGASTTTTASAASPHGEAPAPAPAPPDWIQSLRGGRFLDPATSTTTNTNTSTTMKTAEVVPETQYVNPNRESVAEEKRGQVLQGEDKEGEGDGTAPSRPAAAAADTSTKAGGGGGEGGDGSHAAGPIGTGVGTTTADGGSPMVGSCTH